MNRHDYLASYFNEREGIHANSECSKFDKMRLSPFRFFRGSAALMYKDLLEQQLQLPEAGHQPATHLHNGRLSYGQFWLS